MDFMKDTIEYYNSIFVRDIFEEMRKDFSKIFEMAVAIYAYFHEDLFEVDEENALLGEVLYGEPKRYHGIITEIEGVERSDNLDDDVTTKPVNRLMHGCVRKITPKLILKIVQSQYFMIDVLCEAIYEIKKGIENNYCRFDTDDHEFQDALINYRKSGRKKVEEKKTIRTFKDYGHPTPINAEMCIEDGKHTQIENVVPNIFRLLITSTEIRKLYGIRGVEYYQFKTINRLFEETQLQITPLEKWKLEDVVGINLSAELTELITGMMKDITLKDIEKYIVPEIRVLVSAVATCNLVFCRGQMIDVLERFVLNKEFEQVSIELAVKRIRHWAEIILHINRHIEYEQAIFKNLIVCMVYDKLIEDEKLIDKRESEEGKKEIVHYLEASVLRGLMTMANVKGDKYPLKQHVIGLGEGYSSKQVNIHSLIQREYMQYQSEKSE